MASLLERYSKFVLPNYTYTKYTCPDLEFALPLAEMDQKITSAEHYFEFWYHL